MRTTRFFQKFKSLKMKRINCAIALMMAATVLAAQKTGLVEYKELGLAFTIPQGWVGQETDEGFLMGHNTEPGFILLLPHEYNSLATLRQEAAQGIEDEGVSLKLSGKLDSVGKNGVGGTFTGTLQGQKAKAYIAGLINPHGQGLSIMAAVDSAKYADKHKQLALAVAKSVRFSKPEAPAAAQQWKNELMNKRLYYIYSSSSRTGGYTGMSETEEIWLCAAGYFHYKSSSHNSFDSGGAFGHSSGNEKGAGTWNVVLNNNGGPMLQLTFQNGQVKNYDINGVQKGKLNLGGYKYFYSNAGEVCK